MTQQQQHHLQDEHGLVEVSTKLRHDEQENEDYYDNRYDADDDLEKGRIVFPKDRLYGRDKELQQLHTIYQRMMSNGTTQIVLVPGYSGIGKSALIYEFVKQVQQQQQQKSSSFPQQRPRYVSGKYEELYQGDPYSAIISAMNQLCLSILTTTTSNDKSEDEIQRLRKAIRQNIPPEYWKLLVEMIPQLSKLMHTNGTTSNIAKISTATVDTQDDEDEDEKDDDTNDVVPLKSISESATPSSTMLGPSVSANGSHTSSKLQFAFGTLLQCICTQENPVIFFLDDVQWADDGSISLLTSLLSNSTNTSVQHLLFIGSYRSNEVNDGHLVSGMISQIEQYQPASDVLQRLEVCNLHKADVAEFIADTLQLDLEDVTSLSQAIYNKTLGNIFFTMQGLEELVRQNALYYNMMMFRWDWNITRIEEDDLLCGNVVDMVKSKIQHITNKLVQTILTLASLTRSTIDADILMDLLEQSRQAESTPVVTEETAPTVATPTPTTIMQDIVLQALDHAVEEGLLVCHVPRREYCFAHDRIQEAASQFVIGSDRDLLCYQIATVLLARLDSESDTFDRDDSGTDWMLFTAVHHLNSIPFSYVEQNYSAHATTATMPTGTSTSACVHDNAQLYLAHLNLRTAKLAIGKSAFAQAAQLLRSGQACLEGDNGSTSKLDARWKEQYEFCLDLFNHKMEVEFSLGHHDLAQLAVNEVLDHAVVAADKSMAEFYDIEILTNRKDRNYKLAVQRGVKYLAIHGVKMPITPNRLTLLKEMMNLNRAQARRPMIDILHQEPMPEKKTEIMRLLEQLVRASIYTSNTPLCTMVSLVGERLSFEYGRNKYLAIILAHHAILHRQRKRYKSAYQLGSAAFEMLNKLSEGSSWVRGVNALSGCILPLRTPISQSIDPFNDAHRVGINCGDVEWASTSAMQYTLCYYCAGWPLDALFESKLALFEEEARRFVQPLSMILTFCIFRQTLSNLKGKGNPNPCLLHGEAIEEEDALASLEGNTHKQTLRDISIFRLMLAFIFGNDQVAEEMVNRLIPYPDFDFPIARQNLRGLWLGLAGFRLGRKLKNYRYTRIGKQRLRQFEHLAKTGCQNSPAIISCLKAEQRPREKRYLNAVDQCTEVGFTHLAAVMCEQCGLYCLDHKKKNPKLAESHLSEACWLYNDWGATGKVNQLRQQYKFLKTARRSRTSAASTFYLNAMSAKFSADDGSFLIDQPTHRSWDKLECRV